MTDPSQYDELRAKALELASEYTGDVSLMFRAWALTRLSRGRSASFDAASSFVEEGASVMAVAMAMDRPSWLRSQASTREIDRETRVRLLVADALLNNRIQLNSPHLLTVLQSDGRLSVELKEKIALVCLRLLSERITVTSGHELGDALSLRPRDETLSLVARGSAELLMLRAYVPDIQVAFARVLLDVGANPLLELRKAVQRYSSFDRLDFTLDPMPVLQALLRKAFSGEDSDNPDHH